MSAGLFAQYAVIAVLGLVSLLVVLRKTMPATSSRWLTAASARLTQPWHARWVQAVGRWLRPKSAGGHCGDGCDTCGSCGPKPPPVADGGALPLQFRPRPK